MRHSRQLVDNDSVRNEATKSWKKKEKDELSSEEYCNLFKQHSFCGTRYPHSDTMVELGISEDIEHLYEQTHLFTLMNRPYSAYQEEIIQFLSFFQVEIFSERSSRKQIEDGLGYLTFSI